MMEEATTNIAAGVAGIKSLKTELEDLVTVEAKSKTGRDFSKVESLTITSCQHKM